MGLLMFENPNLLDTHVLYRREGKKINKADGVVRAILK